MRSPKGGKNVRARVLEIFLEEILLNLCLKDIYKLARRVQENELLGRGKSVYFIYIGLLIHQST